MKKLFFGLLLLVTLVGVLVVTFWRVRQSQPTISRPRADAACETPSCCKTMATGGYDVCNFADRAKCSPDECQAAVGKGSRDCESGSRCKISRKPCDQCDGGNDTCVQVDVPGCKCGIAFSCSGGGGGGGEPTDPPITPPADTKPGDPRGCNSSSPNDVWACYQKTGSCSGSWACHDSPGSSACPEACGGLSSCSKDKDCESGEMCKDGKCTGNSCKSDSDCSGNKACIDDTCYRRGQTHLACIENACTRVVGKGDHQDGCTSDSASCVTPVTTHLTCGVDNTCRRVEGSGTSTCLSEGSVCVQRATYLTCRNSTCTRVIGTGTSTCVSENSACGTPTATHLTCGTDKTCKRVAGSGTSTCSSEGSPCGGVSECWGNEGVDGQCYDVNGDSVINILDFSCVSNLWLADITPTSSPKCGGR